MTKRERVGRVCSARRLETLRRMREAKARKRQERIAAGWRPEPRLERPAPRFEFGIRDTVTGETAFVLLRSGRQAARAIRIFLKYYTPFPVG